MAQPMLAKKREPRARLKIIGSVHVAIPEVRALGVPKQLFKRGPVIGK